MKVAIQASVSWPPALTGGMPVAQCWPVSRHSFPSPLPDPEAALLPPNERRRSSDCVRWAVQVAQEAIAQSGLDPREVPTVFASSGGEMGVLDQLCRALATPDRSDLAHAISSISAQYGRRLLGHCHDLPAVIDRALLL